MKIYEKPKKHLNRLFPHGSFVRSVGVLTGGTAFAQGLGFLFLPIITRLYTPDEFSILAVLSSIISILAVAACLRLEIAIPLPKEDEDAANLFVLALIFCTLTSIVGGISVWLLSSIIVSLTNKPSIEIYLWTIPVGIWLTSSYSAVQFWATRKKHFTAIAKTRATQTLGSIIIQIGLGIFTNSGSLGLLLGQLFYCGAGSVKLIRNSFLKTQDKTYNISRTRLVSNLKQYKNYPKFSTFESLANTASSEIPILIIASTTVGPEAGFLFLALKIMVIPIGLIGRQVANVYLAHAAEVNRQGNLKEFTIKILNGLIMSGIGPLILIGITAPTITPLIFGDEWGGAGKIISLLTPWFILQYITSPISMALYVTNNQRNALILQIFGGVARIGSTAFAVNFTPSYIIEFYSMSGALFYLIFFYTTIKSLGINNKDIANLSKSNLPKIIPWIIIGGLSLLIINNTIKS